MTIAAVVVNEHDIIYKFIQSDVRELGRMAIKVLAAVINDHDINKTLPRVKPAESATGRKTRL